MMYLCLCDATFDTFCYWSCLLTWPLMQFLYEIFPLLAHLSSQNIVKSLKTPWETECLDLKEPQCYIDSWLTLCLLSYIITIFHFSHALPPLLISLSSSCLFFLLPPEDHSRGITMRQQQQLQWSGAWVTLSLRPLSCHVSAVKDMGINGSILSPFVQRKNIKTYIV